MKKTKLYKPKSGNFKRHNGNKKRHDMYKTKEWTSYRFRFLHHNPKCYCCGQKSSVVDHIKVAREHPELFDCNTNHVPLCAVCHNTITALYDRHARPDIEAKMRWIDARRKEFQCTVKVKVIPYIKEKGL